MSNSDPSPSASQAAGQPVPQVIIQPQQTAFGRYGRFLLVLLVLAVLTIIGLISSLQDYFSPADAPQERYHSLSEIAQEKIAIIDISGAILDGEGFEKNQIDAVREDDSVVAVVLRINSPGGTVTGSDYLYHHITELRQDRDLPVVVSMGSVCASGGYYIAMAVGDQENCIFAEPTTWTGSIGVVIPHYDLSGLLERYNVKDDSVVSHRHKLMGSPTRELTPEAREEERVILQELVDISFEEFKQIVRNGRPGLDQNEQAWEKITSGRIFTAPQAKELGLIDQLGFLEVAIERAAEMAGRDSDTLRCVQYKKPPTTLGSLLSAKAEPRGVLSGELESLIDLTAPRAYYLYTLLPSLLSSSSR